VIGGLLFATVSTLLFVPAVFAVLHRKDNADGPDHPTPPEVTHVPAPRH